jgi:hypothetical protein
MAMRHFSSAMFRKHLFRGRYPLRMEHAWECMKALAILPLVSVVGSLMQSLDRGMLFPFTLEIVVWSLGLVNPF